MGKDFIGVVLIAFLLIGIYGAIGMMLAPITGYILLTWVIVMSLALIHLAICCTIPQRIVFAGLHAIRIDSRREQVIHAKLSVWIPSLRNLKVFIVEDVSVNLAIFRSHSTVYLMITDRFIERLSGVHADAALCYVAQIASRPLFYTHSIIMSFAVILERLRVTSILAASIIHTFIPPPEDKVWDGLSAAVHDTNTYCEIFKVIIQCMYKSSQLPSSISALSFTDVSHGPLTYESMYAVHLAEMFRKNSLLP